MEYILLEAKLRAFKFGLVMKQMSRPLQADCCVHGVLFFFSNLYGNFFNFQVSFTVTGKAVTGLHWVEPSFVSLALSNTGGPEWRLNFKSSLQTPSEDWTPWQDKWRRIWTGHIRISFGGFHHRLSNHSSLFKRSKLWADILNTKWQSKNAKGNRKGWNPLTWAMRSLCLRIQGSRWRQ